MVSEKRKRKGGAEKERERKKKRLQEIAAKCKNIEVCFASSSTSSQATNPILVDPTASSEKENRSTSVISDAPATDNGEFQQSVTSHAPPRASESQDSSTSTLSSRQPQVSEGQDQRVSSDAPEAASESQEISAFSSKQSQVLEGQDQSVNFNAAATASISQDCSANALIAPQPQALVVQLDHSANPVVAVSPSNVQTQSWFVKPKQSELSEYFKFHPHQPETTKFNCKNVYFRSDDTGDRLQRLWLSYSEENEALFCNLCIAYDTSSKQSSSKFKTGFDDWRHVHQRIDEHEISQKHQHCAEAFLRFSTGKEISTLVAVGSDTSLHNKHVMRKRRLVLDRIVSIIKMIGKRGMSYRGTGGAEKVSSLCDEEVDHGTFLETVLLLTKYDNVMQDHMKNIVKKSLQNKSDKYKHNRANRNTFISKTTVNSIIAVISKLSFSNSVYTKSVSKFFERTQYISK